MSIVEKYQMARKGLEELDLERYFENFFATNVSPQATEAYKTFEKDLRENKDIPKKNLEYCCEKYTFTTCLASLRMALCIFTYQQMAEVFRLGTVFGQEITSEELKNGFTMLYQKQFQQIAGIYFLLIEEIITAGYVEDADMIAAEKFAGINERRNKNILIL